jgi:hypothetical protein
MATANKTAVQAKRGIPRHVSFVTTSDRWPWGSVGATEI